MSLMEAFNKLTLVGLSFGQVQTLVRELVGFARETGSEDAAGEIVGSIPGLSQIL
jgi:hypothetical protein